MSYTLLGEAQRTARKSHRCVWCGERIAPGEKYTNERSIYEGNLQNHHWHPECYKAAQDEWNNSDDCEFEPYQNDRGGDSWLYKDGLGVAQKEVEGE